MLQIRNYQSKSTEREGGPRAKGTSIAAFELDNEGLGVGEFATKVGGVSLLLVYSELGCAPDSTIRSFWRNEYRPAKVSIPKRPTCGSSPNKAVGAVGPETNSTNFKPAALSFRAAASTKAKNGLPLGPSHGGAL